MNFNNNDSQASQIQVLKMKINQCHSDNITHSRIQEGSYNDSLSDGMFCPKLFDGLLCWDDTPAGAVAYQNCPKNVYGWSAKKLAYKECTVDGHWFTHPQTTKPWTNYTTCVDADDYIFREWVINISILGYSISFVVLVASIFILWNYKLLTSNRTKVHMHLFTSLAINCVSWISWYSFIVKDVNILMENSYLCQFLTMLNTYLLTCTYAWMFCEALNLIISLYVVFINRTYAMRTYICVGWFLPILLIAGYLGLRFYLGDVERCMVDDSPAFYFVTVPILVSMVCSFFILVYICWMLRKKARNESGEGLPTNRSNRFDYHKTIKPAMTLAPLFGLYFLLLPVHPPIGSVYEIMYSVFAALSTSLQGLILTFLFCFQNQEVRTQIRQITERNQRVQLDLNQITAATGGDSGNYAERRI